MLSKVLARLHDALILHQQLDFNHGEAFSCARCGIKIESLTESPHLNTGEELLFFCSEKCYARYMQYRLNKQARWAVNMLKKMQHNDPSIVSVTANPLNPQAEKTEAIRN